MRINCVLERKREREREIEREIGGREVLRRRVKLELPIRPTKKKKKK